MVSSSMRGLPRVKLLCALVASCFAAEGLANPTDPAVVSGGATFNSVGKTLTVTNTPNAIINWQGFSIGAGEITRFQQQSASSAVLNRVVGQDPSAILGTLWSNGKVFLVNPNGVLFGQGSRVDVAGLVASTLNITNQDFLAGKLNFQAGAVAGSVVNQGEITSAPGGRIYLISPDVQNQGLISSPGGEVLLAAGKTVSLVDADVPNLKVEVRAGGEALNVGKILADGGKAGIYAGLINQRGVVRADSVSKDATGKIVFKASDTTILDDGSVTSASGAKGGEIQVLGNRVGLIGTAKVDASGDAGGGTVLIGGDYQGKNADVQNAWRTYMAPQSSITADAITSGDGGKVVLWSDDATRAYGSISARGGSQSGNGGLVEVSGHNWLDFNATVNTGAPQGATGVLLLDPAIVNITNTTDSGGSFSGGNPDVFGTGGTTSTLTWATIKTHLTSGSSNVFITSSGCSTPGSCGIDILAASPDLASSNNLRLVSHETINVNGSVTNTGSGALELYAGWDGTSSTSSPNLTNSLGVINVNQPINFAGTVSLNAYGNGGVSGITDAAGATITTPNLLANALNGSVNLSNATHTVGTLAGTFHNQFSFKNGQNLTIGTVGSTSGISTVPSAGGSPSVALTVTSGNLTVNGPISVTDGGGNTSPTSVALTAQNGSISVNNTSVTATAKVDDSNNGQPANVIFNATNGGILISNSAVSANGGNGLSGGDPGGSATVSLNATGGITANSSSTISATGGAPGFDSLSGASGGDANVSLVAGGTIDLSASTVTATHGSPLVGSLGTAGASTVLVQVSSASGNASPSGDIIVNNITADNVNIQQESAGVAKSILRASGTSLIGATQLLMEMDDPNNIGGGSIGTSAAPMRVQAAKLEAHTHEASPGIFIDSPNAQNVQIGGVSFFGGTVKGVQNVASGDISISVNGTLTTLSGSPNSPCGTGTGGPICTTSGNITLRADDMVIGHNITATGAVSLAPFSVARNINVEISPTGGVLSLTPSEIGQVTGSSLGIGRSDGTGTLTVNAPFDMGAYGALQLAAGNINVASNITKSSGGNGSLTLLAGNTIQMTGGADITSTSNKLNVVLNSDSDASGAGRIDLGSGTVITSNGGNVTLGGGANPLTANAFGDGASGGAQFGVHLSNAQIQSGIGNISVRGTGAPGTMNAVGVRLDTGSVLQSTTGSITVNGTGGNGTLGGGNRGMFFTDAGTQVTSVDGTITLTGQGGNSTGLGTNPFPPPATIDGRDRGIDISDGPVISTSGTGNIVLMGTGGTSVDMGSNTGVLLSQASAIGTRITTVNGNISITGTGGSVTGASATSTASRGISIGAAEIRSTGTGSVSLTGTGGTTSVTSALSSNSGILIQGDPDTAGIEAFVTTASGNLSVTGTAGSSTVAGTHEGIIISNLATVQSGGSGTLTLTGTAAAGSPAIRLSGGGAALLPAHVHVEGGGALNVTANGGSLQLSTTGGTLNNEYVELGSNGNETINAAGIALLAGASGSGSYALIGAQGNQNITVTGGGNLTLSGGSGSGNGNFATIVSLGTAQTLTFSSGGNLVLTGGTNGTLNSAEIRAGNATTAAQTQTISGATGITLTGGASGGGLDGSNNGLGNFARIMNSNGSQSIAAGSGGITLTGGGGSLTNNFAMIIQGSSTSPFSPGTSQTITINNGGALTMQGGSSAQSNVINNANNFFRGSFVLIEGNGDSQQISFPNGGSMSVTGGTVGSNNAALIFSRVGPQTISGSPAISLTGGASGGYFDLATNKNEGNYARINGNSGQSITASTITMTGGAAGVANDTLIFQNDPTLSQVISATGISLTGGAGGGGDSGNSASSEGNFSAIQSIGQQTITATSMALHAGAGGIENFAVLIAPTQTMTVHGDVTITGGGSSAGALRGGGASISGLGGTAPTPTNLALTVDGNVAMTGGSVANSGAAIGGHFLGGQPTTITMTVGNNITLNPGSVANSGSRIGSPASGIAGGDIAITAGGTLALNSSGPGLGTAIRTLGNLTITAGSMTQGPDSQIIVGGATTLNGGTILLSSANNDFTGPVSLNSSGSSDVEIADANAIVLGGVNAGTGTLTVIAGGAITQTGPIVQAAGAGQAAFGSTGGGAITLTNASNDFTGPVGFDTTGAVAVTDANSFIIKGGGGGGGSTSSFTLNANGAVTQSAAFTSAPTVVVINAGPGPITLNNASNNFTGNTSITVNTSGAASLTNNNPGGINLGTSSVGGALTLTSGGAVTQSGPITVGGASTLNAGTNSITLANASNDFVGAVNFTGGNVTLTDANAISIGNSNASGSLNIVATSTSFLNGLSANNYTFPSGTNSLGAGTYNLGGTTNIAQNPSTGSLTTVDLQTGATINTSGGTINVGAGGTLMGTGTIQGNVNNLAGTVAPGASPGALTITGNYTQGASGVLNMEIGGLSAGTQYDQIIVQGSTSLAGTLNTTLVNSFVPPAGSTFTLIQSSGPITGTFTTVNQPAGTLFNSFYGPTTFDFVAASGSGGSIPAPIIPAVQNVINSTDQVLVALTTTSTTSTTSDTGLLFVPGGNIDVAPAPETTTKAGGTVAKNYCN